MLRTHTVRLKSDPGNIISTPDDSLRNRDILVEDKLTGEHVHLNLIDTPGLSDSHQTRDANGMSSLDEKHKLGILLALNRIPELHAVCFVVGRHEAYSESFQGHIQGLMRIFNQSFPSRTSKLDYHVIHTWITLADRFPADEESVALETRAQLFDDTIKTGNIVRHHFIDSIPRKSDHVAVHYHKHVISELLGSFSKSRGTPTSALVYPREPWHVSNDQALLTALNVIRQQWQEKKDAAEEEAADAADDKQPHLTLIAQFDSQLHEIQKQVQTYDTSEDVYVASCSETVKTRWFEIDMKWKMLELTSEYPISKYEKSCVNGEFDCERKRETSYRVCLNTINFSAASGTIKIYCQKRHFYSDKISGLCNEMSEIMSTRSESEQAIKEKDDEIRKLQEDVALAKKQLDLIANVATNFRYLVDSSFDASKIPPFQVKEFGDNLRYVTVNNLFATASAYSNMDFAVPKRFLPLQEYLANTVSFVMMEIASHVELLRRAQSGARLSTTRISEELELVRNWNQAFRQLINELDESKQSILQGEDSDCRLQTNELEVQQPSNPARLLRGMSDQDLRIFAHGHRMSCRSRHGGGFNLDDINDMLEDVFAVKAKLQREIESLEKRLGEEREILSSAELSFNAMSEVRRMANTEDLDFRAFVMVRNAINDGVLSPYRSLYYDILETLRVENLDM
ncbi:hypothetical protein MGU_11315 [Metarhizium guizhouense ARSEF 977]|uniref:Uncharacterized protein n=1 Tax=Metarhizium guizhouense (strain ARSEF 977) TaxID=1276136 RepID=A0A0B4GUY2_METGA|nr:hypothetical protein MGU_11315 [Metarhizium guizhouense ARSEF 977]